MKLLVYLEQEKVINMMFKKEQPNPGVGGTTYTAARLALSLQKEVVRTPLLYVSLSTHVVFPEQSHVYLTRRDVLSYFHETSENSNSSWYDVETAIRDGGAPIPRERHNRSDLNVLREAFSPLSFHFTFSALREYFFKKEI